MVRLALRTTVFAGLTVLALVQLRGGFVLAAWLLLVAAAVLFLIRDLPEGPSPSDPPLSPRTGDDVGGPRFRFLGQADLVVRAVVTDHQTGRRRLRPHLARIASHRLARHGLSIASPSAAEMLGEEVMSVLQGDPGGVDADEMSRALDRLERL